MELDSLSRDDRDKHIITRGNVDGIVSAAVFLNRYPASRVSFVSSPTGAARILSKDRSSKDIYLVDIALVHDVEEATEGLKGGQQIFAIDHHPSSAVEGFAGKKVVQEGMSAAGVLFQYLNGSSHLKKIVALADLIEYCQTPTLRDVLVKHGQQKVDEESHILDFSWRLNIEDDEFRYLACKHLAEGVWPSQVSAIKRRYMQVLNEQRWPKAVARVKAGLDVRGPVGIFQCNDKNRSLYGFGTRALTDVAYKRGCLYAMMVNERRGNSSISLRGRDCSGINVGRFVEDFVRLHGLEGGGHPTSAGARIPLEVTHRFVEEFVGASFTR